jgi:hypothetical protein
MKPIDTAIGYFIFTLIFYGIMVCCNIAVQQSTNWIIIKRFKRWMLICMISGILSFITMWIYIIIVLLGYFYK